MKRLFWIILFAATISACSNKPTPPPVEPVSTTVVAPAATPIPTVQNSPTPQDSAAYPYPGPGFDSGIATEPPFALPAYPDVSPLTTTPPGYPAPTDSSSANPTGAYPAPTELSTAPYPGPDDGTATPSPQQTQPTSDNGYPFPGGGDGLVSGEICYPADENPAMTLYFRDIESEEVTTLPVLQGQSSYEIFLSEGVYIAYAWAMDEDEGISLPGSYSEAVACGLTEDCTDHNLLPFQVFDGEETNAIDVCDWEGDPEEIPAPDEGFESQEEILPALDASPEGLIFNSPDGMWKLDSNGDPQKIAQRPNALLSPDGLQVLFSEAGDIWIEDVSSGIVSNLTQTPNTIESSPGFWPANPELIVFSAQPPGTPQAPGPNTYPATIQKDGSEYQLLEGQRASYGFALSPDGKTIAYSAGKTGWLYDTERNVRIVFNPLAYDLELGSNFTIASPAFSPDGNWMTWMIGEPTGDGSVLVSVAVFDLINRTAQLLHPYRMGAVQGMPGPAVWGPDGQWILFAAWPITLADQGLWAYRSDGSDGLLLGQSSTGFFHPTENLVAFEHTPVEGKEALILFSLDTEQTLILPGPEDMWLSGWMMIE